MDHLARAQAVIPGGVNSPVRAFKSVGGSPIFVKAAEGAYLIGEDGRRYLDYIGGYGPHIHGHGHPRIKAAIAEALEAGTAFGVPTVAEIELAETICGALPSVDLVRLVNSGTEATMSALRVARAATRRDRFVKFVGCYHGHADAFLVAAGSGAATLGVPSSPGVPAHVTADALLARFNDLEAVEELFRKHGDQIAGVIVEPIAGNVSLIPPLPGFLEGLRELTSRHGAVLIFDEVMTGFRVGWTSAQGRLGVEPDLTTFGKVIGGGMPLAAYGGRRELMEQVSPAGPVYQAGTLSGNRLAVAAGLASLRLLEEDGGAAYRRLEETGQALERGLAESADRHGVPLRLERAGSMLGLVFTDQPVVSQDQIDGSDRDLFTRLFHGLLEEGVHLAPSAYETLFFSTAHGPAEVEATLTAFDRALERAVTPAQASR